jgi:metal-responsive CopG/Arc/MetJ family transcriptional regulator
MRVEAQITLEKDLLATVDSLSGGESHRSELIEAALQSYISNLSRRSQKARDREIIEEYADELNGEAIDVLDYQVAL